MPNHSSKSSRSGKSKSSAKRNSQTKFPDPPSVNNSIEVSGYACCDASQKSGRMTKTFKLPVLNPPGSSWKRTEVKSPALSQENEWKVPKLDSNSAICAQTINSQTSFIRSVSASESESWSDDTENEMTAQLAANLSRLNDLFYSDPPLTNNKELAEEIRLWQSRFPCLRVVGKKAKLFYDDTIPFNDNNTEKEEIIVIDGHYDTDDFNNETKNTSERINGKNNQVSKNQMRNLVINQISSHFFTMLKNDSSEDSNVFSSLESDKKNDLPRSYVASKPFSIKQDLKLNKDLDQFLNISPIALKSSSHNYKASFFPRGKESFRIESQLPSNQSADVRLKYNMTSARTASSKSFAVDIVASSCSARQTSNQKREILPKVKSSEVGKRKIIDTKFTINDEFVASSTSRFGILPPLKTLRSRPTSAFHKDDHKLRNGSRPPSSFKQIDSLLKDKT